MTVLATEGAFGLGAPRVRLLNWCIANGGNMISMLQFDQSTLANMTAALEYVCRKLPPDKDNQAVRKHIADEILAACQKGRTSHGELASVGLKVVNGYLFPPGRAWLRALGG